MAPYPKLDDAPRCRPATMMAYPPPPQQLRHVPPHGSKAAPPLHVHGQGRTKPDAVSSSLRCDLPADARGLRALVKALSASAAAADEAASVHAHATKLGLDRERTVRNGLIALYLACGDRAAARALFDGFPGSHDVVSWTAMVTGHTRLGFPDAAVALFFALMDDADLGVDAVAAAAGFAACAASSDLALARAAHRRVTARKVALDSVAWNALLDMYAKCGDVAAAHKLFRTMPPAKRNVVTWNTMISAFTRAGGEHASEALSLFREMQMQRAGGVRPDDATLVAVLGACAQLGALDSGRWVHAYYANGRLRRFKADGVVGNALLDMYAKCGAADHALAVFEGMERRDVYTYASMILGLATHGRAQDALALFAGMRRAGVRPNAVALLGVLSACCHAGLVEEGLRHLDAMAEVYGVAPGIEHYGCAVDMLCRAGRLDEAEELVAAMPVRPDVLVWGSLLAACRAHGNVERAERLIRRMAAEDQGADAGDHVLLSNIYASRGRHGRAVRVRRQMRRNKIVKDPGSSLIEIDGVVHEFRAVPANSIS